MQVNLHFYAEFNRFLLSSRRDTTFTHDFEGVRSIKDLVESLGVPHTEIARYVVNGSAVPPSYIVQDGDDIRVYPAENTFGVGEARFVLDVHLGRLAAYLRMLGFDTLYPEDYDDANLARISHEENRILLSRDVGLLKRSIVKQGYFVRETDPWQQLAEVLRRYDLFAAISSFSRCTQCNGLLAEIDKNTVADRVPPGTQNHYDEFRECTSCEKIYWKGSHYDKMVQFLDQLQTGE